MITLWHSFMRSRKFLKVLLKCKWISNNQIFTFSVHSRTGIDLWNTVETALPVWPTVPAREGGLRCMNTLYVRPMLDYVRVKPRCRSNRKFFSQIAIHLQCKSQVQNKLTSCNIMKSLNGIYSSYGYFRQPSVLGVTSLWASSSPVSYLSFLLIWYFTV